MAKKKIPDFSSEAEEAHFWSTHSIDDYLDGLEDAPLPQVSPEARTQAISLRLSTKTLTALKQAAAKRGVGYQTLMKQWLEEKLQEGEQPEQREFEEIVVRTQTALSQAQTLLNGLHRLRAGRETVKT
ncbi:MAG: CopG family antitoxin [Chloroflexota bacterium]